MMARKNNANEDGLHTRGGNEHDDNAGDNKDALEKQRPPLGDNNHRKRRASSSVADKRRTLPSGRHKRAKNKNAVSSFSDEEDSFARGSTPGEEAVSRRDMSRTGGVTAPLTILQHNCEEADEKNDDDETSLCVLDDASSGSSPQASHGDDDEDHAVALRHAAIAVPVDEHVHRHRRDEDDGDSIVLPNRRHHTTGDGAEQKQAEEAATALVSARQEEFAAVAASRETWSRMNPAERKKYREKARRSDFKEAFDSLVTILLKIDPDFSNEAQERAYQRGIRRQQSSTSSSLTDGENAVFNRVELVNRAASCLERLYQDNLKLQGFRSMLFPRGSSTRLRHESLLLDSAPPLGAPSSQQNLLGSRTNTQPSARRTGPDVGGVGAATVTATTTSVVAATAPQSHHYDLIGGGIAPGNHTASSSAGASIQEKKIAATNTENAANNATREIRPLMFGSTSLVTADDQHGSLARRIAKQGTAASQQNLLLGAATEASQESGAARYLLRAGDGTGDGRRHRLDHPLFQQQQQRQDAFVRHHPSLVIPKITMATETRTLLACENRLLAAAIAAQGMQASTGSPSSLSLLRTTTTEDRHHQQRGGVISMLHHGDAPDRLLVPEQQQQRQRLLQGRAKKQGSCLLLSPEGTNLLHAPRFAAAPTPAAGLLDVEYNRQILIQNLRLQQEQQHQATQQRQQQQLNFLQTLR